MYPIGSMEPSMVLGKTFEPADEQQGQNGQQWRLLCIGWVCLCFFHSVYDKLVISL